MLNNNSSNELEPESEPFILCRFCNYTRIYFIKGTALPYEFRTKKVHYCAVSEGLCKNCSEPIYLDKRILSPQGKKIPLDQVTGKYHICKGRNNRAIQ